MTTREMLEILGYVASALVAVSLMMRSVLRLRLINLVGSAAFTAYGALIGAYPVAAVNAVIVLINLYYLRQMLGAREYFTLLELSPEREYVRAFLTFHDREIRRFLPRFSYTPAPGHLVLVVLRDLQPAGLFIGEPRPDGTLLVHLDYVIPQYRDLKVGRFLFEEQAAVFRARGIREIVSPCGSPAHVRYLRRMGFTAPGGPFAEDGLCRLVLGGSTAGDLAPTSSAP